MLQFQQDWIQGALIESENISADLLDSPSDAIAVQGLENIQRLEHHESERSLSNVRVLHLYWVPHKTVTYLIWESNRTRLASPRRQLRFMLRSTPVTIAALELEVAEGDGRLREAGISDGRCFAADLPGWLGRP